MSKKFTFRITEHSTQTVSEIPVEIPDEEWQALQGFVECADELAKTEFLQQGIPSYCQIQNDGTIALVSPLPPTPQVREFLHVARPLILTNEPFSYDRVTGILSRRIEHPLWRNLLKNQKKSFRADSSQYAFVIRANGLIVNSEEALNLWLNGYEYHRDQEKRAKIEATTSTLPLSISQALFLDLLAAKAENILEVADLIRFLSNQSSTSSS